MTKLEKLLKEIERAEAAFAKELRRQYPVGAAVTYRLRGGKDADRYPWQEGEIVGYHKDGRRLRVRLAPSRYATRMERPDRHVNSLPISKIRVTSTARQKA